jgi:hypothetical protein
MEWSYSRINSFTDCPYAWFLKYIKELPPVPNFYSQYGKFIHLILQRYFKGELRIWELATYYISNFALQVTMRPQRASTYVKYFKDGLDYLSGFAWQKSQIIGVEREVHYTIGNKPARGFIDLEEKQDGIIITDHKSAELKQRSKRKKPTQDDILLDEMFRQLYLYALAVYEDYGEYPTLLRFNPFRTGLLIEETFDINKLNATVEWATNQIQTITNTEQWHPNIDYFRCNWLCDMRCHCEYYEMNFSR